MHAWRTKSWYLRQLLLAIGTGAFLFVALAMLLEPASMGGTQQMLERPHVWIGIAGLLFGLGWLIRIARSTREDPPRWRHRDR